ncbi:hypothetical protein GGF42_000483 [Coemansia sp. RSA 2424]|nr:hypothetical protein GGF42_000483 [Coemansia sp. RSA 2424]
MGQAYSHWSSEQQGRRPAAEGSAQRQARGNARSSGRAQNSVVRGGNSGREDSSGRSDNRYSPYTTGSRTASATTTRANAQELVRGTQEQQQPSAAIGAVVNQTITVDVESNASPSPPSDDIEDLLHTALVDLTESLEAQGGEAEAERRWEREDAEMQDAAHVETFEEGVPLPPANLPSSVDRGRARVSAGNQLLSRIVSRSVITSISRELERRRPLLGLEPAEEEAGDHAASAYVMDFTGRLSLYYHVSVFILSVLEANVNAPATSSNAGEDAMAENPVEASPASLSQQQQQQDGGLSSSSSSDSSEAMAVDGDDGAQGLQFRMFLLPGAIDQALDEYASTHAPATAPATTESAVSSAELPPRLGAERGQSAGEQRRALWQRQREERLRRLRNIARAMHDERRGIQVPVAVLGLRMNSELRRSTRTALQNLGERMANTTESPPTTTPPPPVAPSHSTALQDALRGLRNRLGGIVPGFLAGHSPARGAPHAGEAMADSDIQPAAASSSAPGAAAEGATAEEQQPGLSVFITIHYMQLGNPLMLPMAAYALFPELVADDSTATGDAARATESSGGVSSGNNYDLFMEIANIIGQASSNTVSQDLVDKRLRKYSYHKDGDECPVARLVADSDDDSGEAPAEISLVSADRCPVCLEDFEAGDVLRVLECHHGLHMTCGDAWFTKGSNKCPICRSEAVHLGTQKT